MNEEASAIHNLKATATTDFGGNDMVDGVWWKEVYVSVAAASYDVDPPELMHFVNYPESQVYPYLRSAGSLNNPERYNYWLWNEWMAIPPLPALE